MYKKLVGISERLKIEPPNHQYDLVVRGIAVFTHKTPSSISLLLKFLQKEIFQLLLQAAPCQKDSAFYST